MGGTPDAARDGGEQREAVLGRTGPRQRVPAGDPRPPESMRAFAVDGAFGLDNLRLVERELPTPGPGQVRLRMKSASLNFRDLLMVKGHYNPKQPLPLVPLSDGVGEVDAVGDGVTRVAVGDRVAGVFSQKWISDPPHHDRIRATLGGPLDGCAAEYMVLSEEGVAKVPAHLSDAEAATFPCAGVTAWNSLRGEGNVQAGETVLILGTGGVSIFALQFATLLGARTIVTSSSDEKLERAKDLGAWATINYRETPEWWREVRSLTDKVGVDHVVEVGGAGTFDQSVRSTRSGGHVSLIGVLAGPAKVNLTRVLMNNICVQGVLVGSRDRFEAMNAAVAHHEMRPVVDRVFGFEELPEAFAYLESGAHFGKIALEFA